MYKHRRCSCLKKASIYSICLVCCWLVGGGMGGVTAKQFGTNAAWQHLRPLQWAEITFQKAPPSPPGAAATGWTLFVLPPHAAGFRGGEGQRCEEGREGFEWKWGFPASQCFQAPTLLLGLCRLNTTWTWPQAEKYCCKACYFLFTCFLSFESPYFSSRVLGVMLAVNILTVQRVASVYIQLKPGTCADLNKLSNNMSMEFSHQYFYH